MKEKKISKLVLYGGLILLIFVFGVSAQIFMNTKLEDDILSSLEYKEEASLNYKVFYKENPFYDEQYIEEGKTYIQEYINNINADFSYKVNYNKNIPSGNYEYYFKARLIAYTPSNADEDLWTKEYELSSLETVNVLDNSDYQITKSIDLDYQSYRNDFLNYCNGAGIKADGKLIVEMIIKNHGTYQDIGDFDYGAIVSMEIPLSDATFKIKTSKSTNDDVHKIVKFVYPDHEKMYLRIIGILLWILCIFTIFVLIIVMLVNRQQLNYYEKKLKKILSIYDHIIVNVEKLPSIKGFNVVEVTDFDELVDAQNEVRLPINFFEDKKKKISIFLLIHDKLAWVYTLKEGDSKEDMK